MKERLTNIRPFADAWQDKDETHYPKSEVGYIRADYEDRWWNTVWPIHRQLETPELVREFDTVYAAFCREFPNFNAVCEFCRTSAEPTSSATEFNAYLEGEHGVYWFRFITRYRDYNLYLHCLSRAALEGEQNTGRDDAEQKPQDFPAGWKIGDTCVLITNRKKGYTRIFTVIGFEGKYFCLKDSGGSLHHASVGRMFRSREQALGSEKSEGNTE